MDPRPTRSVPAHTGDRALVLLAIGGDNDAFAELVRRHQSATRTILYRLSGDRATTDDLAQIAFIKAWRSLSNLRDPNQFPAWLRRISTRVWIDLLRTRRPEAGLEDVEIAVAPSAGGVELADVRLDVQAALAQLGVWARTCVVLFHADGMSHSEIAEETGLPMGTVKSHITRSTQRLRQKLAGWRNVDDE